MMIRYIKLKIMKGVKLLMEMHLHLQLNDKRLLHDEIEIDGICESFNSSFTNVLFLLSMLRPHSSDVQPRNASIPTYVTQRGMLMLFREMHPSNALDEIRVTLKLGMKTETR